MKDFVPAEYQYLLEDETKAYAYLATTMADGSPQVTPVWFTTEGDFILINTVAGRVKDRNIRAQPRVALLIPDPENPYRYLQLRGRAVERVEDDPELIHRLSEIYTGNPRFNIRPGDLRVTYKILPDKIYKYDW